MPTFQHVSLDAHDKKAKGFIEAESRARAFTLLQDKGLTPLELSPVAEAGTRASGLSALRDFLPMGRVRLAESFYYLGVLLQSGHSLAKGLDLIGRMSHTRASRVWLNIRDTVESGEQFSKALTAYPRIFPPVYVGMIKVAESTGKLGQVLERIAKNEDRRSEAAGRLATAMVYPMVILLVGMGAVYFLLSNVLPKISDIFAASKGKLPITTTLLLSIGKTLNAWGPAALLVPLLLLLATVYAFKRIPRFRLFLDRVLWKVPIAQKYLLARFSGMLGFQLEAGIPLVQAMESSAQAVGSSFFRQKILEAMEEVAAGRPLDRVFEKQGIFPEVYILTLTSGQKAGRLGPFLLRLTHILERDVDNVLKRLVALAEPLLILCVGLVIGFIVLAIMEPIFSLTTLVK